ncbi:MAG TPA: hypothetical protein VFY90_03935 [Tepidiformaceae bacterium]|nr:hypothetical protein [Tepidiformaceae bacterium]
MAPRDRRGHGALPVRRSAGSPGKQREALCQTNGDLVHRQGTEPRGRELGGQWKTVNGPEDGEHRPGILFGQLKGRVREPGTIDEELDTRETTEVRQRRGLALGHVERGHAPDTLARDSQWFAAGTEQAQPGTITEKPLCEDRQRLHYLLAIVEDEQDFTVADQVGESFDALSGLFDSHRRLYGAGYSVAVVEGGEVHEERAIREPLAVGPDGFKGEPGLPNATWTGERDETRVLKARCDVVQLSLTAKERGEWPGQHRSRSHTAL